MVSPKYLATKGKNSPIREAFEHAQKMIPIVGKDNVFDFSLGNPSTPPRPEVLAALEELLKTEDPAVLHGYSANVGFDDTREACAQNYNRRFGTNLTKKNFLMTYGATTALIVANLALHIDNDTEVIVIAPFFPGYGTNIAAAGNKMVVVPPDMETFQINFEEMEKRINAHTQAIIINSPNNPSGVIYDEATIMRVADLLTRKSEEFGHPIYIICDEPYRELVYTDAVVPYVPKYYKNTIICYCYSKSLSLAGERIGFVATDNDVEEFDDLWFALKGAANSAGNVCAPTLFQKLLVKAIDVEPNMDDYIYNRELLFKEFGRIGYEFARPEGAFYLFFKAPHGMDPYEFAKIAREKYNVMVVPGFGTTTHMRLAYCVSRKTVENSIPLFEKLYNEAKEIMDSRK